MKIDVQELESGNVWIKCNGRRGLLVSDRQEAEKICVYLCDREIEAASFLAKFKEPLEGPGKWPS